MAKTGRAAVRLPGGAGFSTADTDASSWWGTWVQYRSDRAAIRISRSIEFDRADIQLIRLVDGVVPPYPIWITDARIDWTLLDNVVEVRRQDLLAQAATLKGLRPASLRSSWPSGPRPCAKSHQTSSQASSRRWTKPEPSSGNGGREARKKSKSGSQRTRRTVLNPHRSSRSQRVCRPRSVSMHTGTGADPRCTTDRRALPGAYVQFTLGADLAAGPVSCDPAVSPCGRGGER